LTDQSILLSHDQNVAIIRLNRPDRLNALTTDLLSKLLLALDQAVGDGARAILITGEGRAFCSGADLAGEGGIVADLGETLEAWYHPLMMRLAALDIPVVSAVNGPAVGAGVALALAADIVMMARSAYLQLGFVNIGLVPDAGATWLIAKSAGRAKALEMALLGERMSAQDARDCGLVTRVVDDEALFDEALAIAQRLAEGPSVAIGLIRKQVAAALNLTQAETLALEASNQSEAGRTADFREGVTAFREKRPPTFKGH
jgi:2-(1,2-epoxy-1,2-dihydrophenyl)acetyl-CoA isomerase